MQYGGLSEEVTSILSDHHAKTEGEAMTALIMNASFGQVAPVAFLNKVREEHDSTSVRGLAAYALAKHESDEAEKERMLEDAISKVGDFKMRGQPIADMIKGELNEIRLLGIGKVAPEIQGEDIDGVAFKLSGVSR